MQKDSKQQHRRLRQIQMAQYPERSLLQEDSMLEGKYTKYINKY